MFFQLSKLYLQKHKALLGAAFAITVHKNTTDSTHSDEGTAHSIKSSHHTSPSVISHDARVVLGAAVVMAEMELLQPQHVCRHTTRVQHTGFSIQGFTIQIIRFLFIYLSK